MATVYPHITTFPCLLCVLEPPWDPALVSQKQAESGGKLGGNAFLYGHCSFLFLTFFFFFAAQQTLPSKGLCCPFSRISEFVCQVSQKIWLEVELGSLSTLSNRDNGHLI